MRLISPDDPVMDLLPEIVKTSDGSDTLYVPSMDEHYHSVHGAIMESQYIFISCGFEYCRTDPVRIFEVGFGTGLNVLLTLIKSLGRRKVSYTAIEKNVLPSQLLSQLNYPDLAGNEGRDLYSLIHACEWGVVTKITDDFSLHKIRDDLTSWPASGQFDVIYFDAFGPDKQPEMWTDNIFSKISLITAADGIFITYSAKGEVRRSLTRNGFQVTRLPGPPGKRQIIRAVKN